MKYPYLCEHSKLHSLLFFFATISSNSIKFKLKTEPVELAFSRHNYYLWPSQKDIVNLLPGTDLFLSKITKSLDKPLNLWMLFISMFFPIQLNRSFLLRGQMVTHTIPAMIRPICKKQLNNNVNQKEQIEG